MLVCGAFVISLCIRRRLRLVSPQIDNMGCRSKCKLIIIMSCWQWRAFNSRASRRGFRVLFKALEGNDAPASQLQPPGRDSRAEDGRVVGKSASSEGALEDDNEILRRHVHARIPLLVGSETQLAEQVREFCFQIIFPRIFGNKFVFYSILSLDSSWASVWRRSPSGPSTW